MGKDRDEAFATGAFESAMGILRKSDNIQFDAIPDVPLRISGSGQLGMDVTGGAAGHQLWMRF
ncbi:MAG TPA: hypothetical protein VG672_05165 [Bryobacteraceae bacterium]|jgi:hypothetical protein|nr:hypothetical protein [Bryobacteraceae bacterium]